MSRSTREGNSVVSTLIDRRPILKAMLHPKVVALIGATEAPESVGHSVLENLDSFRGIVHLINGKRRGVLARCRRHVERHVQPHLTKGTL